MTAEEKAPRSRRRRKPDEARLEILAAATRFLSTRPLRELTVGTLMNETGLSRTAFYFYFTDIHELLLVILEDVRARIESLANPWLAGEGEPRRALRESLRGVVLAGREAGPFLRAISESVGHNDELERAWAAFMGSWDALVQHRIEQQQAQGLVPALCAAELARALNLLNASMVIATYGRPSEVEPESVVDTLYRIWSGALYGSEP